MAPVNVTRTLHHSVNVEGHLDECVDFYRGLLRLPDEDRPAIPGVGGHWFAAGDVQLHLVDADAGSDVIRPTGPHACFAVYEAGNTRQAVDPRQITDRVVPDGWPR